MNQPPYLSLTEAITSLAFNEAVTAADIGHAISSGRWGTDRATVHKRLVSATNAFCDAGFAGGIECWGIRSFGGAGEKEASEGDHAKLTKEDYLGFRRFIEGHDALWKRQGNEEREEGASFFSAFSDGRFIQAIKVERSGFDTLLQRTHPSTKFTGAEREKWIADCPEQDGDRAYVLFKAHPKWDGTTQEEFRIERRRLLKIRGRGRRKS